MSAVTSTMATRIGHLLHRAPPGASNPVPEDDAKPLDATEGELAPSTPSNGAGRTIGIGDLVVVYEGFNRQKAVTVAEKGCYQNRYGTFPHKEWVGKPFGSKVYGKGEAGFVWILAPTPELWTKVLPHRTQILYLPDISLVCHALELKPGSVVLESGTGSGSLTHSLIRAVAPKGHVYTFEFNRVRAEAASEEIVSHGLTEHCTVTHRDVEALGFPDELEDRCDAAFLDLPGPHKCIPSVAKCLRPDGVVCSFSPCIEQVQRCCQALEAEGTFLFIYLSVWAIVMTACFVNRFRRRSHSRAVGSRVRRGVQGTSEGPRRGAAEAVEPVETGGEGQGEAEAEARGHRRERRRRARGSRG